MFGLKQPDRSEPHFNKKCLAKNRKNHNKQNHMQVLVIDDEEGIRMGLQMFLENTHALQLASSAEEGIHKIEEKTPDAILLDMHMEGGNGDVVLEYLAKNSLKIPVIVTSAFSTEVIQKKFATEPGKWIHLRKPIDLKILGEILASLEKSEKERR